MSLEEIVKCLGIMKEDVDAILSGNRCFRLYLLPSSKATKCTWDNFIQLVAHFYEDELPGIGLCLQRHLAALKNESANNEEWQNIAADWYKNHRTTFAERVAAEKKLNSEADRLASLSETRAFLCAELGLFEEARLPFTKPKPSGGMMAYMVPNAPLKGLRGGDTGEDYAWVHAWKVKSQNKSA
eukprot:g956.t1